MVFKYVKPYIWAILLVIFLIVCQAMLELSLPQYMSNIVNIGIGQSGIETPTPEIIRRTEMEKLFSPEDEIFSYYRLIPEGEKAWYSLSVPPQEQSSVFTVREDVYILESAPDNWYIAGDLFIKAFENGSQDAEAAAIQCIINEYKALNIDLSETQNDYIFRTGGIMLVFALISACAAILASLNSTRLAAGFARDLRKGVFTKVMDFSSKEFDRFSTASLITRSTNDIQQLQMLLGMGLRMIVFAPAMGIGAVYKVVTTESELSWILAVAVCFILVVIFVLFSATSKKFKKIQTLTDNANRVIREALSGMLVIRAFADEKKMEDDFDKVNTELSRTNRFTTRVMSAMFPFMSLAMNFAIAAIIYFGASYVDSGIIQIGTIMAFIQYSTNVIMSFMFISMISIMLPRGAVSLARIKEVLSSDISIKDPENAEGFVESKKGLIEFKDVSFQYSEDGGYVINNINFTALPGQTTAVIGTTGSGKTTIVNLIPRLYEATLGEVLVDGVNVKNVNTVDLRKKISYAPQKGILFSGTIETNIKFAGENTVSDAEMKKAAEIAQAEEFISGKEEQFESLINQGGSNVSGGQRQRISIARALAKESDILIFDDSFSALDYKTDSNLRKALKSELSDKTVIIVAQRVATIKNAEKILVMDQGYMVGEGTHDELMSSCDVYRQIAQSQLGQEVV